MDLSKFNIFKFKYGKQKKSLKELIKIGAIIHGSLDLISIIPGVEKRKVFNLLDEFQLKMGTIDVLNDYIIHDDELIGYRINRVIDNSIQAKTVAANLYLKTCKSANCKEHFEKLNTAYHDSINSGQHTY